MSPRRSAAIARHEFRVLIDDPSIIVLLLGMPLLMMAFMKPLFRLSLAAEGFSGANGADQAVPGMAVMFAAFTSGSPASPSFASTDGTRGKGSEQALRRPPRS